MRANSTLSVFGLVVSTGLMVPVSPAAAQSNCKALLQGGTFDTGGMNSGSFAANHFRSRYCDRGKSSSSSSSSSDFSMGLPIPDLPINFGYSDGSSNSSSSSHDICNDQNSSSEDWKKFQTWSRQASPVLAKAFLECVRAEGIQLWTERSHVTNAFSVNARVHYETVKFPPVKVQFSFTPAEAVGQCSPISRTVLEQGVKIGNFETFKVVCQVTNRYQGIEVGLVATSAIPYGSMSIRPERPVPIFVSGTDMNAGSGVKVPQPGDATYGWGGDTLLDRYDGATIVPPTGSNRWASWNLDNLVPGRYQVYVTYAAEGSRPLRLLVDGQSQLENVAAEPTGSWKQDSRQKRSAGEIRIARTNADLRLETMQPNQSWPHFKELRLLFIGD